MRLFLDANVLFTAAHNETGISQALCKLAEAGYCTLLTSAYAVEECRRNLTLKFPGRLKSFSRLSERIVIVPEPPVAMVTRMTLLPLAEKDCPIMAAAVSGHADILVTGDRRDFGHLYGSTVEGVLVLPPADTLDQVLAEFG